MSLIEKFNIKFDFKNFIIISSFIISFYFWDFGAKYNLGIDTRYLTLIPLLFFINNKIFTNKGAGAMHVTPATFRGTDTKFVLAQFDGCTCIWDGASWFLVGNQCEVTVS